jgi:hypothetical protein
VQSAELQKGFAAHGIGNANMSVKEAFRKKGGLQSLDEVDE